MVLFPAAVCHVSSIILGIGFTQIKLSLLPKGDCFKCCPIDDEQDIRFLLYTRNNPNKEERLYIGRPLPEDTKLDPNRKTVIYLHGFTEVTPGNSGAGIRDAYLSAGDFNVILVDWGSLIALPWYIQAVQNTPRTGNVLAHMIRWLSTTTGIQASSLHVIGFSLGAEVAAISGKLLVKWGQKLGRITGLDPAFPLYNLVGRQGTLSPSDANFVDVIHTNAGVLGYPTPVGHVDFYPNAGSPIQPGCSPLDLFRRNLALSIVGCSHRRAWQYYAESVRNPTGFIGRQCLKGNCTRKPIAYMGYAASPRARGKFYVNTNSVEPFARNL